LKLKVVSYLIVTYLILIVNNLYKIEVLGKYRMKELNEIL